MLIIVKFKFNYYERFTYFICDAISSHCHSVSRKEDLNDDLPCIHQGYDLPVSVPSFVKVFFSIYLLILWIYESKIYISNKLFAQTVPALAGD